MIKVLTAEYSGVCFGVRRALEILEESVCLSKAENKKVVMFGPLIHNPRVVESYLAQGVEVSDINGIKDNTIVVIRSHGIVSDDENVLKGKKNISIMDTTCPYVKRIHQLVMQRSLSGYAVIVMGDENHSEVKGITSRIKGDYIVVPAELNSAIEMSLSKFVLSHKKIYLVAQTTSVPSNYEKLIKKIRNIVQEIKDIHFEAARTVCKATLQRQDAAEELASRVDAVVVIGGKNSSNTSKLFSVVKKRNHNSFMVESPEDFSGEQISFLMKCKVVGITAGASTPDEQIKEMKIFLEKL